MSKPAFTNEQHQNQDGTWNQTFEPGMSLLEYYAGEAMKAIIIGNHADECVISTKGAVGMSKDAFNVAEAMVKEAEKRQS